MVEINKDTVTHIVRSLEPLLDQMMTNLNIPSINLAVTNKTEILFAESYGAKDLKTNTPPTLDTIYMLGSCSKTYAALSIMQLVEQGKIDLNAPIKNYIPITLGSPENPITVKNLLTHTSGLSDIGMGSLIIYREQGKSSKTIPYSNWNDFYRFTNGAQNQLVDVPGKRFIYSNTGFTLLAQIVASVSQMPYEDYVQEHIFSPLNMTRSCFTKEQLDKMSDIATLYYQDGQPSAPYHEPIIFGCGGVISSTLDQVKYLQMMLNFGKYDGKQIISAKSIEEMEKAHIESNLASGLIGKGFGPEAYGYGWMSFPNFCGIKALNHAGSTGNGSANLFYSHDLNIGIAGTSNHEAGTAILAVISFLISGALCGKNPMELFPSFTLDASYANLQGIYSGYKDIMTAKIRSLSGLLYIDMLGPDGKTIGFERPLIPVNDNNGFPFQFYSYNGAGVRTIVEFTRDEQGIINFFDGRTFLHKSKNL